MKKYQPKKIDWIKGFVACALYIAFLVWIQSWWGIVVLPFIFDAYITRKINWGWWKDLEDPILRTIMSWVDAIVFALVAVYFVNIYFFQNYTIPSSSLEKSLLVGDYLFVSKMTYGPRVPQTPLHAPLCQHTLPLGLGKSYIESVQWDYKRVSPKKVTLNDIVVFNYPAGDTIAYNWQNTDYYRMCKELYMYNMDVPSNLDSMSALEQYRFYNHAIQVGSDYVKSVPAQFGKVQWRPVDRRENYVKRCVGLPGQTLEIRDHIIYLDGVANKEPEEV
jgi:signal peptidase I